MGLEALETRIQQIDPEKLKLFDWYLDSHKNNPKPLAGKRILVNAHQDRISWKLIHTLINLGATVEAAQIGTHGLPIAEKVLSEAGIPFYKKREDIPHEENYYDICLDCGGALRDIVLPKLGMVELTHVDQELYKDYPRPLISVDQGDVKVVETRYGTGQSWVDSYIELLVDTAEKVNTACKKNLDAPIQAMDNANEDDVGYTSEEDSNGSGSDSGSENGHLISITYARHISDCMEKGHYRTLLSMFTKYIDLPIHFGKQKDAAALKELLMLLESQSAKNAEQHSARRSAELSDTEEESGSIVSTSPPSDSFLASLNIKKQKLSPIEKFITTEKFVIFGAGKVGSGIAFSLLKAGVPPSSITIIEASKGMITLSRDISGLPYNYVHVDETAKMKTVLKNADVVITATGQENLLTKMGLTPDDIPGKLSNMGHSDELGENFKNHKKILGNTRFAFNFNKSRMNKKDGGYPTDPLYLMTSFVGLCSAAECLAKPDHGLKDGFQKIPLEMDAKILAQFSYLHPNALSKDLWQFLSQKGFEQYRKEMVKIKQEQGQPQPMQGPITAADWNSSLSRSRSQERVGGPERVRDKSVDSSLDNLGRRNSAGLVGDKDKVVSLTI